MTIRFDEDTIYGQDLLVLAAEVAELMDPDKLYSKTEIYQHLYRMKNWAGNIISDLRSSGKDGEGYSSGTGARV